ncbi:MAG: M23 family metallopeptidase [Oscillospiraceae bacterium]
MGELIKDRNNIINSGDCSTLKGTAAYTENANIIIKENNVNGREKVRNSLDSTVRGEVKNYNYAAPAAASTEKTNAQRSYIGSRQAVKEQQASNNYSRSQEITSGNSNRSTEKNGSKIEYTCSKQRIYSQPENITGSNTLSGAAATAMYVSTTEKIIKDEKKGMGREYVRNSLESNVKNALIKDNGYAPNVSEGVAVTETERAAKRASAAKKNGEADTGTGAFKPASEAKADGKKAGNKKGAARLAADYTYRSVVNATAQGGKDGGIGDRASGQSIKYMIRTPRYVKAGIKGVAGVGVGIRYSSKVIRDIKAGALTGKEAGLSVLKRGGVSLKGAGKAAATSIGRTVADFHGSDDLGVEAIRKPKDMIVGTNRTLKVTSRAVKSASKIPAKAKRTLKSMQKAAQKAKQAVHYAAQGIKMAFKALSNPIVLKTLVIGIVIVVAVIVMMAAVSSVAALFSSFTYNSNDDVLTDTYAYITELDADIAQEILDIPTSSKWSHIDEFHIYETAPLTDPVPIISYLTVKYDDFKYNATTKGVIDYIHSELYNLTYYEWVQEIEHSSSWTDDDGVEVEHTSSWTEYIYHLDVDMDVLTWEDYVITHKDEIFTKPDDYSRYQTYNDIGGTALRTELGFPFLGQSVPVSSRFGYRIDPVENVKAFHAGIDIPMPSGTPINAAISGKATTVAYNGDGYGYYVIITSGNRSTLYAHCNSILVANGEMVTKGQEIATVGSTGKSTGNHLHFEFVKDGKKLNPYFYIESEQFN